VTKAPALKTVHLRVPASTQDLAALELGNVVYLTGRIFTAREGVYKKAVEDGAGLPAPPSEIGFVNFHCSPAAMLNPDGSATVGAVTATASFRFAKWLDGWFKISHCNIIIGKAGMTGETYKRNFVPNNAIYLTTVGYGTGALLGAESNVSSPPTGSRSWAWPRPCGSWTWRISGPSWSRAILPAQASSSARTPRLPPTSPSSTPAPSPPRCAATARRTTKQKMSSGQETLNRAHALCGGPEPLSGCRSRVAPVARFSR
jgi:tartrate dehydratase beta subunit/fumarate hydratase class I family protein